MGHEIKYEIPEGTQPSICRGCTKSIWRIKTPAGKNMPVDADGRPHWATCSQASKFKRPAGGAAVLLLVLFVLCGQGTAGPISVYFLAGQSNASGYAPAWGVADQMDVIYRPTRGVLRFLGPVDNTMGPEVFLGRTLTDAGDRVAIVKYAIGGTDMDDWDPVTGQRFAGLVTRMNSTLGALVAQGYTPTVRGGFWMQGEEDALTLPLASAYGGNLTELLAAFRRNWGQDLPVGIGRINAPYRPYRDLVRQAQEEAADARTWVWDTDDLPLMDRVHYSEVGQMMLGNRLAAGGIYWRHAIGLEPWQGAAVPEPSTWQLLGGFACCLGLWCVLSFFAGMAKAIARGVREERRGP